MWLSARTSAFDLASQPGWQRWGFGIALFLLALGARFALIGALPPQGFPFLTFFPAVMLTAYLAGLWPGLFVSALSVVAARYFFIQPVGTLAGTSEGDAIALVFFSLVLIVDCFILHVMTKALANVRATSRELRDSQSQLQLREAALRDADRRKDEFLAVLAHELRNPLSPLSAAAHVLKAHRADAPELAAVGIIQRQVRYMARLLDDLLDVSRITANKLTLHRKPQSLASTFAHAVEAVRPLISARAHELTVTLPDDPPTLFADPVRIEQILVNLLNNAAKYTPAGGRIELAASVHNGELHISVADTGVGLTDAQLPLIFERFGQVGDEADRQGGLGIGLSLARDLARLHGGEIEATSHGPGRGSTFVFRLPLENAPPADVPVSVARTEGLQARRVLVADDNRDAADTLAAVCSLAGMQTATAYDGREALRMAEATRPDVMLLDIGMPHMDGYEVARRIRATDWGAATRLIAISGRGRDEDRRSAHDAGFDHHFVKPVDPERLFAALASA
jgi:signal transduction histidine kinase